MSKAIILIIAPAKHSVYLAVFQTDHRFFQPYLRRAFVIRTILASKELTPAIEEYSDRRIRDGNIGCPANQFLVGYLLSLIHIFEELIFRGQAFCLIRDRFGWRTAVFLSALLFGLYHGSVVQGVYAFFLGLGAAWLLQRFGTLLAPWLFHMAANLISVLLEHFSGQLAFLNLLPVFLAETGIALGLAAVCFLGIRGRSAGNERPRG